MRLFNSSTPHQDEEHPDSRACRHFWTGYLLLVMVVAASFLAGCTTDPLANADYVCIDADVEVDGYFTDSSADGRGRGIKVPEGEKLTPELAANICPPSVPR